MVTSLPSSRILTVLYCTVLPFQCTKWIKWTNEGKLWLMHRSMYDVRSTFSLPVLLFCVLTLGRTCKFIPPPWYKGMKPSLRVFDMLQYFEMILRSVESLWPSLQDKVYYVGGGTTGGLWCHLGLKPRIWNQVKTARSGDFLCLRRKITHKWALCMILTTIFCSIVEKSWKNIYFHSKMACPPPTYGIMSRNHRNRPSLNLTQNEREGWSKSHKKRSNHKKLDGSFQTTLNCDYSIFLSNFKKLSNSSLGF